MGAFTSLIKKNNIDWPINNFFETLGMPQLKHLFGPQLKEMCIPRFHLFIGNILGSTFGNILGTWEGFANFMGTH
jgi:hypothetical protein